MAVFKLTERIWWGTMNSPIEAAGQYKSVIDLASNYTAPTHHYSLSQIPDDVLVIRFPTNEDRALTYQERRQLSWFINGIFDGNGFPLLIHCFAGQCRSPILAIWAEMILGSRRCDEECKQRLDELTKRMFELRTDIDQKRKFHADLRADMERLLSQIF